MIELNKIYNADCIGDQGMRLISDNSIDMILCDLPYGTTEAIWDYIIDPVSLWSHYKRVIKESGSIVLTAQNPFSAKLICSNIDWYKHSFIWEKDKCANFLLGNHQPLKIHEDVLIFAKGGFTHNSKIKCTYNPQLSERKARKGNFDEKERSVNMNTLKPRLNPTKIKSGKTFKEDKNLAKSVVYFATEHFNRIHPTQKPVALFEYLIKTYSNEQETILDNCMGSGTTAIACINTNRNYIGIEKDFFYYTSAINRIQQHTSQIKLF